MTQILKFMKPTLAVSAVLWMQLSATPSAPKTAVRSSSGDRYKHEMDLMLDPSDLMKMNKSFYSGQYQSADGDDLTKSTSTSATFGLGLNDPLEKKLFFGALYKTYLNLNDTKTTTTYTNQSAAAGTDSRTSTHDAWVALLLKDVGFNLIYGLQVTGSDVKGYYEPVKTNVWDIYFTPTGGQTAIKSAKGVSTNYHVGRVNSRVYDNGLTITKKLSKFNLFIPLGVKFTYANESAKQEILNNSKAIAFNTYAKNEDNKQFSGGLGLDGVNAPGPFSSMYKMKIKAGFDMVPETTYTSVGKTPNAEYDFSKMYSYKKWSGDLEVGQGRKFDKFQFKSKPVKLSYSYAITKQDLDYHGTIARAGTTALAITNRGSTTAAEHKVSYKPEIGAEFTPHKITTFRAGAKYTGEWKRTHTIGNYQPKAYDGISKIETLSMQFYNSKIEIGFGMGFNLTPNLKVDAVASTAIDGIGMNKNLTDTTTYSALLTYTWDGPAMKVIKK